MHEWAQEIGSLSREDAGALTLALMDYYETGEDEFSDKLAEERENIADLLLEGTLTMDQWLKRNEEISILMDIWRRYRAAADRAIATYNKKCQKRGSYKKTLEKEAPAEEIREEIITEEVPDEELDEFEKEIDDNEEIGDEQAFFETSKPLRTNPFSKYLNETRNQIDKTVNEMLASDDDNIEGLIFA